MNALATTASNQFGSFAALLNPAVLNPAASISSLSTSPEPVAASASFSQAEFLDLISVLFETPQTSDVRSNILTDNVANPAATASADTNAAPLLSTTVTTTMVSNNAIAESLVRSMLNAKPTSVGKQKPLPALTAPGTTPILTDARIAIQGEPIAPVTALSVATDQVSSPAVPQPAPANPQMTPILSTLSQTGIAFAARLTPADPTQTPASQLTATTGQSTDLVTPVRALAKASQDDNSPRAQAAAATISWDGIARVVDAPAAAAASPIAETKGPAPFAGIAETLRTSEPEHIAPPQAPVSNSFHVNDISVRIARPESPAIDLRFTERAGEIHVAVRTPDAGLEAALRRDLPALTNSLERAGYRAETFVPRESHEAAQLMTNSSSQLGSRQDREAQREFSGGRGEERTGDRQDERRQRNRQVQDWIDEMEKNK